MLLSVKITRVAAGVALATVLLGGCTEETVQQTTDVVIQPALTEVVVSSAGDDLNFNGVVRSAERADLAFRVGGMLTEIQVNEGDQVRKGDLLARLDPRDARTDLESAQLELKNAKDDYERATAIFNKSQAISRSDLDTITTKYNLARNKAEEAARRLEYTELKAPFDGIIGRKLVDNHSQITANTPAITLHDLNDLEVVINLPDKVMLSGLRETSAIAELAAIPGQSFPLTMRTWASQADPVSQTYPVVLGFSDLKGLRVLPGMAVKVLAAQPAEGQSGASITVPLTAIVPDNQGGQFVWVVGSDNTVSKRAVDVGNLRNDRIVVEKNLKPGERVIAAGVSSLKEGMEVHPYSAGE